MNDCVHFDGEHTECGIFNEPCEEPSWQKGCYLSTTLRNKALEELRKGDPQ